MTTMKDITNLLDTKYRRYTIVERPTGIVEFHLPRELTYIMGCHLELLRPLGLEFKASKLSWWKNWFHRKQFKVVPYSKSVSA